MSDFIPTPESGGGSGATEASAVDTPATTGGDRSLSDLLSELAGDFSTLVRQEVDLAKAEVKQEAKHAGQAAGPLIGGAVAAFVALLLFAFALAWGLAEVLPPGFAFLIVALLFAVVGGVLLQSGRKKLQQVDPAPTQTIETLKEDKQWLQDRR